MSQLTRQTDHTTSDSPRARRSFSLSVFVVAVLVGTAVPAFAGAGGIVDFENFSNSLITINSVHDGPSTGPISGPTGSYYFALLGAEPTTTTIDATLDNGTALDHGGWLFTGNIASNTVTPGYMDGNYTSDPGVLVNNPEGDGESFAVVGWSGNIGSTYADAKAWWNNGDPVNGPSGYFAISNVAQDVLVGGGIFPVPTIFGPTPDFEVQGFTLNLYTVPEPSTFLIAVLGGGALLLRRRRR